MEEIRREKIVACLRKDHPLAAKAALQIADLQSNLTIFYHPQRHPEAHQRLLELLGEAGLFVDDFSRASHPSEMLNLVREGHGLALIREGTALLNDLTTRHIIGVDWTVDCAVIYRKDTNPKTIPALVRILKRQLLKGDRKLTLDPILQAQNESASRGIPRPNGTPVQLSFSEEMR